MDSSSLELDASLLNVTEFQKLFGHQPGRDKYMIKLAIIGYPGTGKSAFIKRFCDQVFPEEHKPSMNIEVTSEVIRVKNSVIVEVFLYEVAGQTQYIDLKNLFVHGIQGIIVMFAVHYEHSFKRLQTLMEFVDRHLMSKVPVLVVGNSFEGLEACVSVERAQEFCKKWEFEYVGVDVKRFSMGVDKCVGFFIEKLISGIEFDRFG